MFINKIINTQTKSIRAFKGYQHEKNDVGDNVMRFNAPVIDGYVDFYKVKKNPDKYLGYEVIQDNPVNTIKIEKNGTLVNIEDIQELKGDEIFAYRLRANNMTFPDTGLRDETGKFNLVSRVGTTPLVQGAACLVIPDSHRPGARYVGFEEENTGEIVYNPTIQAEKEQMIRNFSNKAGGNLAGMEYDIPLFKKMGIKVLFSTPVAGGDNVSSHRYWNKNNMQIAPDMASLENFATFTRLMFKNGLKYVNDGTFTSEGLEGIHFQYALRWAHKNPQTYYWFRMSGIKNAPIGFGVVPKNYENLRHRVINPPVVYDPESKKVKPNLSYDKNKETYFQLYDGSQVSDEQLSVLDKPIEAYEKIKSDRLLDINTHDDTLINYVFAISPNEYVDRLNLLAEFNKKGEDIVENSPEGTLLIAQFSNFKCTGKTEGGMVTGDANTDMVKMNYGISGYDTKMNQAIVNRTQRDHDKALRRIGAFEVQDLALQAGRYWTSKVRDLQTLYVAKLVKDVQTEEQLNELIKNGELPLEAKLSKDVIENIKENYYLFDSPVNSLQDKKLITVQSLMKLPLDSLELGENTVGVLSSSYFSNRATDKEFLGLTRFELMQKDNLHLIEPYTRIYLQTEELFNHELRNFAEEIIKKVNDKSSEKLLDEAGNYTRYGEYIINLVGQDIAKYALLKAIGGEHFETKILANGDLTYNYDKLRANTTLKSLNINAYNPTEEASQLLKLISKGLDKLSIDDVEIVAESINKRISGTSINSFYLADAIVSRSGLGLDWRLDAAKDIVDMDAVRNGTLSFDDAWQAVIDFWKNFVQAVKKENPHSYIVAEITDVEELIKSIIGEDINAYGSLPRLGRKYANVQDAMAKFFLETGVVSEAAYSYTFTDFLKILSSEFERGSRNGDERFKNIGNKLSDLIANRTIDYIRNLYTFADNHDKPSVLHGMALDMSLFHADLENDFNARKTALEILTNSNKIDEVPIEARLNINNMEYFGAVSTKALALAKLYREIIKNGLEGVADPHERGLLKQALTDLVNANEQNSGLTLDYQTIKINELSSVQNATEKMLELAGLNLPANEISDIVNKANEQWLVERHLVKQEEANNDDDKDLYTAALAGLIADAFSIVRNWDKDGQAKMLDAYHKFIELYPKSVVEANRTRLPIVDSPKTAAAKNAFAAKDFEQSIRALVKQAKFLAEYEESPDENLFSVEDKIIERMFRAATEPAVQKALIYATYLVAFPGISTVFFRDLLGSLGFDEKSKNIFLQNRNVTPFEQLEHGPLKEYRTEIFNKFKEVLEIRKKPDAVALNNGTPYLLESSNPSMPALLMQDGYGNMVVSIFNSLGIEVDSRVNYFEKLKITDKENREKYIKNNDIKSINIDNPYVPIQPQAELDYVELPKGLSIKDGTVFENINSEDKEKYVVREIAKNVFRILRESNYGNKLVINGTTAKNGVLILKHVAFKGDSRIYNKQFNFVSNPYSKAENSTKGENLSIIK